MFPNEEVREESELTRADENVGRAIRGETEKGGKKGANKERTNCVARGSHSLLST